MDKREDVIAGLKKMRENGGCEVVGKRDCEKCPYSNVHYCCDQIIDDALELLKAQEPRVMTLEDVMKLRFNDVVYFEMTVSGVVIPAIVIDVIEHMPDGDIGIVQFRLIQEPTANCDLEYYGKKWRCWTSRPTDEQREETPWMT